MEDIHIGKEIENKLRTLKWTQAKFAEKLGIKQPSVNSILKKSSIDTSKLVEISEILEFNFFELFVNKETKNRNIQDSIETKEYKMLMDRLQQDGAVMHEQKLKIEEQKMIIEKLEGQLLKYEKIPKVGA